jgi:hypothetical protein
VSVARLGGCAALAALAAGALPPSAGAQEEVRALAPARVAGQLVGGALTTPVAFLGVGALTKRVAERVGASPDAASRAAYVGAWSGSALATAAVPAAIGARGPGRGSYAAALGGTLVGGAASWLLVRVNRRPDGDERPCRIACTLAGVAVLTLPSIGATVGYDLSRKAVR